MYFFSTLKAEALLFYAFSILTLCIFAMPKRVDNFFAKKTFSTPMDWQTLSRTFKFSTPSTSEFKEQGFCIWNNLALKDYLSSQFYALARWILSSSFAT